jgi:hypothetical protein
MEALLAALMESFKAAASDGAVAEVAASGTAAPTS